MTEKPKVRGLMDMIPAEIEGTERKFSDAWLELGLGATPNARRWAKLGYLTEQIANLKAAQAQTKPRRGRPSVQPHRSIDARRAFTLWWLAHDLGAQTRKTARDPTRGVKIKTRKLIEWVKQIERGGLFRAYVSDATLEQSVARGRTILKIDDEWRSEVCEKIAGISSQTT